MIIYHTSSYSFFINRLLVSISLQSILKFLGISLCIIGYFAFSFSNTGIGLKAAIHSWKKGDPPIPIQNEIVMPPESTITYTASFGFFSIRSGKGLKRFYTWDEITRSAVLSPRKKRWYGSLGLYYPGPGNHWIPAHKGISRGVLSEGQQHFHSYNEAIDWLSRRPHTTYRNDGLVVSVIKILDRRQLAVEVWQIYIDGKKPTKLPGSENSKIITSWDLEKPEK